MADVDLQARSLDLKDQIVRLIGQLPNEARAKVVDCVNTPRQETTFQGTSVSTSHQLQSSASTTDAKAVSVVEQPCQSCGFWE